MKTILLVCNAGISTSLLVNKIKKAAEKQNLDAEIFAVSIIEFDNVINERNIDVVLMGPQIKHMEKDFRAKLENKNIPLGLISMISYGMMDGEKVLAQAIDLISK